MKFVPRQEYMEALLKGMLENDELLDVFFCGAIVKIGREQVNYASYFGITNAALLVATMNTLDVSKGRWFSRIPLNVKSVRVRNSVIPNQRIIHIKFTEGNDLKIRAYGKIYTGDIGSQELNIERFIEILSGLVPSESN